MGDKTYILTSDIGTTGGKTCLFDSFLHGKKKAGFA